DCAPEGRLHNKPIRIHDSAPPRGAARGRIYVVVRTVMSSTLLWKVALVSIITGPPPVLIGGFAGALTRAVSERLDAATLRAAHHRLHVQAVIIAAWYLVSFTGVILASGWLEGLVGAFFLSLRFALVGFNIQHDANHNAFFAPS